MNISTTEVLNSVLKIFENENIRFSTTKTVKAGIITGVCTVAGGFFGGHLGIAIGGLAGTAINSYFNEEFVPVAQIIKNEMSNQQRMDLAKAIVDILKVAPVPVALSSIMNNEQIKSNVINTVLNFVQGQGYKNKKM